MLSDESHHIITSICDASDEDDSESSSEESPEEELEELKIFEEDLVATKERVLRPRIKGIVTSSVKSNFEDSQILFMKDNKDINFIKYKIKILSKNIIIYKENEGTIFNIIPLRGMFPCDKDNIHIKEIGHQKYYSVTLSSFYLKKEQMRLLVFFSQVKKTQKIL